MTRAGLDIARVLVLAALLLGFGDGAPAEASGSGSGRCGAAVVRLGPLPGAIDFVMRCKPQPEGKRLRFAIGLSPVSPGMGVRVRSFQRHPEVRESRSSRRGVCRLYGGGLACSARIHSSARVGGRLWVKAGSECDARVVITESGSAQPCAGVCSGEVPAATVILEARPRGC